MKKLKIMLLSFAVLAVVGSALAFKASFATTKFCTTATNNRPAGQDWCTIVASGAKQVCPTILVTTTNNLHAAVAISCTTTPFINGLGVETCKDAQGANLPCFTSTTLYVD